MPTTTKIRTELDEGRTERGSAGGGAELARRAGAASRWRCASAAEVPGRLPPEVRDQLSDGLIDELLAGARTEEEIVGSGGLLADLTRRLVERAMSAGADRASRL